MYEEGLTSDKKEKVKITIGHKTQKFTLKLF